MVANVADQLEQRKPQNVSEFKKKWFLSLKSDGKK